MVESVAYVFGVRHDEHLAEHVGQRVEGAEDQASTLLVLGSKHFVQGDELEPAAAARVRDELTDGEAKGKVADVDFAAGEPFQGVGDAVIEEGRAVFLV